MSSVSCKSNISHTLLNRRQSQAFAVVLCSNWFGPARPGARVIVHGILQAFHGENICTSCHYGKTMHQTINHINHQHHQLFFGRIPMIFVSSIEKFAAIYTWPPWYFHISCWSQSIQLVWLCLCWQKWLVWTKLNASQYDNDLQSCSIFTTPSNSSLQFAVGGFDIWVLQTIDQWTRLLAPRCWRYYVNARLCTNTSGLKWLKWLKWLKCQRNMRTMMNLW